MSNLFTYTVLDTLYETGALESITGTQGGSVGGVNDPADTGISIYPPVSHGAYSVDPVVFSFPFNKDARILLAKIVTPTWGEPSLCTYSILDPHPEGGDWGEIGGVDVSLKLTGVDVAGNPHGVAEIGGNLYIINYDDQSIYRIPSDFTEHVNPDGTFTVPYAYDVSAALEDAEVTVADARGQALIAMKHDNQDYLFALYIVNDPAASTYEASVLIRLAVTSGGALSYDAATKVGFNAQEIIPVLSAVVEEKETDYLLIPAIGGEQTDTSHTIDSTISKVEAFADDWDPTVPAPIAITGDNPGTMDIHAVAASDQLDGTAYILMSGYNAGYTGVNWALYKTTVATIIKCDDAEITSVLGTTPYFGSPTGASSINFWDILYENADDPADDRLWFVQGSPILVTLAEAYDPANKLFPAGTDDGEIGNLNVNSVDLTAETLRQAAAGRSLKRGFRSFATRHVTAAGEQDEGGR